jgi:hypothetical protein
MDSPLMQPISATRDWVGYSNGFFDLSRDGIFGFFWILSDKYNMVMPDQT